MKNLSLVSVLLCALWACQSDETTPRSADDDRERSSEQQTPNIEPPKPGQEAPVDREALCGTPEVYPDLGTRFLFPARVAASPHPDTGEVWTATLVMLPVSEPKQPVDLLMLKLLGGHGNVPFVPVAGTYDFPTEPLAKDADNGLQVYLFANVEEEDATAVYIPVGGKLVLDDVSLLPGEKPTVIKGALENVKFAEFDLEKGKFTPNGCTTTVSKVSFDQPVLPLPGKVKLPEEEPTEEPGEPPVLEGEPSVPPVDSDPS